MKIGEQINNHVESDCLAYDAGALLLEGDVRGVDGCPLVCYDAAYMTCPSSGDKHLSPECNCCLASSGCTLYNADGTTLCTAA